MMELTDQYTRALPQGPSAHQRKHLENMVLDKTALITGAGCGNGEATAPLFASQNATVALADMVMEDVERLLGQTHGQGGKGLKVPSNVSKPADPECMVHETMKQFGRLDIAVNNAGIAGPAATTGDLPIDGQGTVITINLSVEFHGMRDQIPALLMSGGASTMNMASIMGKVRFPTSVVPILP